MIGPLHHIDIKAVDPDEMVAFYELLGYEVFRETDHVGGAYELRHPDQDLPFIEIVPASDTEDPGIRHFAFSTDDIEAATTELKENGVHHLSGPQKNQDTGRTLAGFRGPDGRWIQLVQEEE